MIRSLLLLCGLVLCTACSRDRAAPAARLGLPTVFDSTGDTIRARVQGVVDEAALRSLTVDWRLSGEVGDTIRFGNASQLTPGARGTLAFVDGSITQVLLVAPDGTFLGPMGRKGGGPGEYEQISGLVGLPDGRWAIYDAQGPRVSFFSATGQFETAWPMASTNFFGQGMLSVDTDGTLRVAQFVVEPGQISFDARNARARVLDGGRVYADTVFAPTFGVKASEYRASAAVNGGRSSTMLTDQLSAAEILLWHPDGHWLLLEGGTYRVLFDRRSTKPLVVERTTPPIPVDPDERAWHEDRVLRVMRRTDPTWTWQGPPIAQTRAPARSAFLGRDGRVWVQVSLPSEPIPEAERDAERPGGLPSPRWRSRSAYEVFDRNGTFVGRVTLPVRAQIYGAEGDWVWGTQLDEDDVPTVVRWRVVPGFGG